MRVLIFAAIAAFAFGGAYAQTPDIPDDHPSPFPVARGTAPPPPAPTASTQAAPPEGQARGGIDFGPWRGADPDAYSTAFQTQISQRLAGKNPAQIRADLEANGFACEDGPRLDCQIEVMERQCGLNWYVVVERNRAEPIAGFASMCLGAR